MDGDFQYVIRNLITSNTPVYFIYLVIPHLIVQWVGRGGIPKSRDQRQISNAWTRRPNDSGIAHRPDTASQPGGATGPIDWRQGRPNMKTPVAAFLRSGRTYPCVLGSKQPSTVSKMTKIFDNKIHVNVGGTDREGRRAFQTSTADLQNEIFACAQRRTPGHLSRYLLGDGGGRPEQTSSATTCKTRYYGD